MTGKATLIVFLTMMFAFPVAAEDAGYQVGEVFQDCDVCPEMVVLPVPGTFEAGNPEYHVDMRPLHAPAQTVTINYQYAVGRFELLTQEFQACVDDGTCVVERKPLWSNAKYPARHLSFKDASDYVTWLSKKTGKSYRLLSESEWEFAARGGKSTRFWWGDEFQYNMAICGGCSDDKRRVNMTATGPDGARFFINVIAGNYRNPQGEPSLVQPNPYGLYFMYGNVQEIVADCSSFPEQLLMYGDGSPVTGHADCVAQVIKGSGFGRSREELSVSLRSNIPYERRIHNLAFTAYGTRIALTLNSK